MSLRRFHEAQANRYAGYDLALAEIRRGWKSSHWIWYIFPHLAGLGHSSAARHYAIHDLEEAAEFLRDPVLCGRFREITAVVHDHLSRGADLETLLGSHLDAVKLISSLSLFRAAAEAAKESAFADVAGLWQSNLTSAATQGFDPCLRTLTAVPASRLPAQKDIPF